MFESKPQNEKESELFTLLMDYRDGEIGVKPIFREIEQQISKSEDAILDKAKTEISKLKCAGGESLGDDTTANEIAISLALSILENLKSKK